MPLLWRVFATNAAVLAAATLVLVISPATVSFPIALTELIVLAGGLGAMLALDLMLLRRAFGPLRRLTAMMRGVDPLRPGGRATVATSDPEVAQLTGAFNEMLDRLELERRDSARRALSAQESERRRIARELHDQVGQVLTAALLQLERLQRDIDDEHRASLEDTREAVRGSLEDVRAIASRLRPEALDDLGLNSALTALTNDVARQTGISVDRSLTPAAAALSPEEELVVYRVAQEALTNAVRHSGAQRVSLTLAADNGAAELTVRDDGGGFDPATVGDGSGLRGMRERAVLIDAVLDITSTIGAGTTVRLTIR
ncbi:MAG TPA: histidine kinase [Solirubrobacteraceae bacterium]|jgi:two-component system sensor histidine kinase UhpB|nr:histidine kinase [Solirubrobacteraceae bacterium]